jgi:hypothetical protein
MFLRDTGLRRTSETGDRSVAMARVKPATTVDGPSPPVIEYKRILQSVLENRPSATRLRLAAVLGKNRSFISQIANPAYSVPVPYRHLDTIFEICHFPLMRSVGSSWLITARTRND